MNDTITLTDQDEPDDVAIYSVNDDGSFILFQDCMEITLSPTSIDELIGWLLAQRLGQMRGKP